jgi:hypothetical protein
MIQLIELRDSDATHQKKNNSSDEVLNSKVKSIIYQSSIFFLFPLYLGSAKHHLCLNLEYYKLNLIATCAINLLEKSYYCMQFFALSC